MSTMDKYIVTLKCRPAEGSTFEPPSGDGACVVNYPVFATSRKEALEHAFAAHVNHCDNPCGNCDISAEVEISSEDLAE
jgi:hypothetical protein